MITLLWYSIKMIQIFALLTVMSGLYFGFLDRNMNYELKMFFYGGIMFYLANWLESKFINQG